MTLREMADAGHESVSFFNDPETGLRCIVAIYDTRLGPAAGGTRLYPYETEAAALSDALRLSKAMAYKTATAGAPLGGGKAVVLADPSEKTTDLLHAYGRVVDSFDGKFLTGEDVNVDVEDLAVIMEETPHVGGAGGGGTDATAYGVVQGMRACLAHRFDSPSLEGRRVVVQGVGKVGVHLVERLTAAGAEVVVADVDRTRVEATVERFGVETVAPDAVYGEPCDVFAPCALGGVLNDETVDRLACEVVCGSANNQLDERRHADALAERGVLYAPDYVVNAGGLIAGGVDVQGGSHQEALERTAAIRGRTAEILDRADRDGVIPLAAADARAEETMAAGGESLFV